MTLFSQIRETVQRVISTGSNITNRSDIDAETAQKLQEVSAGRRQMTDELLNEAHAEIGDVVQAYCDHPQELQNEYFDGDWLHRDCKCGTYLGTVEDQ
ncbi:hypothetical protein [Halococcus salifodinae]|uniref:Uncharacterized protein n=1 Tax=Halococcus salifodinae DSM 8989 TaxID=1227456 RepID=M0MSM6_9EURY|nr:hypothetical protein [Halococcus salifodinae]EMA48601.1 hypothetical protein C450_19336 [Halococcus salifodinae DSM 8989]